MMAMSPLLKHGSDIDLVCEAPLALRVQIPVALSNIISADLCFGRLALEPILRAWNINHAINLADRR